MDPILLLIPSLVYGGFVAGIVAYWIKRRNQQCKFTEDDERLFEEMLKRAAEDGKP